MFTKDADLADGGNFKPMKKNGFGVRPKKKYILSSYLLTVLIIVVIVIVNVIVSSLTDRFAEPYINTFDMRGEQRYDISDECFEYLKETVFPEFDKLNAELVSLGKEKQKIRIIFCDDRSVIEEGQVQSYVLHSVEELAEKYPDYYSYEFINVWEHPSTLRPFGVTSPSDVVAVFGESYVKYAITDFYVFENGNTDAPVAYYGEMRLATASMIVTLKDRPKAYFTVNHGESSDDYALLSKVADAGYSITYLDTLNYPIPDDCSLLVTYDPTQDFTVSGGVSDFSEIDKLEDYMNKGGNYMVFMSPDSFLSGGHKNFEAFLSSYGVSFDHKDTKNGDETVHISSTVRDLDHAVKPGGYSILSRVPEKGYGSEIMSGLMRKQPCMFSSAAPIIIGESFESDGNGNYNKDGISVSPLLTSFGGAEAFAGGKAVDRATEDEPFNLITVSRKQNSEGASMLMLCGSLEFAKEEALYSTAYGNSATVMAVLSEMGSDRAPKTLNHKPFADTTIDIITTRDARIITLILTLTPLLIISVLGIAVIVRRKYR